MDRWMDEKGKAEMQTVLKPIMPNTAFNAKNPFI